MKANDLIGQSAHYTSVVPGFSSKTAFIAAFNASYEAPTCDLIVLDESKKSLLNGLNWWQAFRIVADVPHLSEEHAKHGFELAEEPTPSVIEIPVQSQTPDYAALREQIGDYKSTFYGPHPCVHCGVLIVKQAIEQGGTEYEDRGFGSGYLVHLCPAGKPAQVPNLSDGLNAAAPVIPSAGDLDAVAADDAARESTGA